MKNLRTCTVMVYTDGKTSRYAVMQGPMGRKGFNCNRADIVAIYEIQGKPDYAVMTAKHASVQAPAVHWQA